MNRFVLPPFALAVGLLAWLPAAGVPQARAQAPALPDPALGKGQAAAAADSVEAPQAPSPARSILLAPSSPGTLPPGASALTQTGDAPQGNVVPEAPAVPPTTGKNRYVDRNPYGEGRSTLPPLLPPAVELTERSTGCRTTIVRGQLVDATCRAPDGETLPAPPALPALGAPLTAADLPTIVIDGRGDGRRSSTPVASLPGVPAAASLPPAPVPSRLNPANYVASALNSAGEAIARRRPRLKLPGNGDRSVLYPLAMPGRISSLFGWRTHPIFGGRRFHSGTDIAAPQGTPVLAAYSGRVATAGSLSGYGLTVILRHGDDTQESRYAHLSEILVRPGEWVEQGTEIGRVGSTGNSTGPHLHFEWRQREGSEWVAVDAGEHLKTDGLVSLGEYRQDAPETGLTSGRRASWYVFPTVPPEVGHARPLVRPAWKFTGEPTSFALWHPPLPYQPILLSWLRWQPPALPTATAADPLDR